MGNPWLNHRYGKYVTALVICKATRYAVLILAKVNTKTLELKKAVVYSLAQVQVYY